MNNNWKSSSKLSTHMALETHNGIPQMWSAVDIKVSTADTYSLVYVYKSHDVHDYLTIGSKFSRGPCV